MTTNNTDNTDSHDLDVASTVATVQNAEDDLLRHFNASEATIDAAGDSPTARLEFRGFEDLDAALERVTEVARRLDACPEVTGIHCGVNSDGMYDPHVDEMDDRPSGWVNADLEASR